jgi:hypothetical protein
MKTRYLFSTLFLVLVATSSFAGRFNDVPVTIDFDAGFAEGSQLTAKTSKNEVEFIGCGIRNFNNGFSSFRFGFCQAEDAAGNFVFCDTQNPSLLDDISSISDYAYITFDWIETAPDIRECIRIGSSTQSWYLPDKKAK